MLDFLLVAAFYVGVALFVIAILTATLVWAAGFTDSWRGPWGEGGPGWRAVSK